METLPEYSVELHGADAVRRMLRGGADEDPGWVIRAREPEVCQLCFAVETGKAAGVGFKEFISTCGQKVDALIDGGHEDITGAAGLIDAEQPLEAARVYERAVDMDESGLGECGERFVQAVDHEVCAEPYGGFREDGVHSEMCPMCFVYDQRNAVVVRDPGDLCDI